MPSDKDTLKKDKPAHILIVEDDSLMSMLLSDVLSSYYIVSVADTVTGALEKSYQELPDLILCDIKLPDGSGLKILQTLKQNELTSHIPIIVISAMDSNEDVINGLKLGADDYISKPFSNAELLVRIKTQLENRQRIINWYKNQSKVGNNLASKEQQFMDKLKEISNALIQDGKLSVDTLAGEMAHSKRQLQRKVKEHLNCSCSDYIFGLRMTYASSLNQKGYSTKEITAMIGYKDAAHFNRIFKKYLEKKSSVFDES